MPEEADQRLEAVEAEHPSHYCPACDERLEDRGCKLKCPKCGYFMSCSDFH
jgi:tRNA(Ile2) C34 agmatinyltransferase TiaS